MVESDVPIRCPYCFVKQWIEVDPSEGDGQQFIQDCEVCCRPMEVGILWDELNEKFRALAKKSSGLD